MSETERIAARMRRAWYGPGWHGPVVRKVLAGVTAEVAGARPTPGAHTIWELANHISAWREAVLRGVDGGVARMAKAENFRGPVEASAGEWRKTLARFRESERRLFECIARLKDADLNRAVRGEIGSFTLAEVLNGVVDHDLYHAGQIMLLRRTGRSVPRARR